MDVIAHYDLLIDENNDPFYDSPVFAIVAAVLYAINIPFSKLLLNENKHTHKHLDVDYHI